MGKSAYFRVMFFLYWAALLVCGGTRIYLKLFQTDLQSGFYTSQTPLIHLFNYTLLAAVVLMMLINRLKTVDNDYPLVREGVGIGALSILSGIFLALYVLEDTGWLVITGHGGTPLRGFGLVICGALGTFSALSLFAMGLGLLLGRRRPPNSFIALVPAIWQLVILIIKFNSYTTLTTIADNLLIVLFMVFASMFMIGHARTVCSLARRDSRNYVIPTGLATSITGLLLTVPNYVHMFLFRSGMPAQALGDMESLYVFFFSVYAFASVVRLRRSIAVV